MAEKKEIYHIKDLIKCVPMMEKLKMNRVEYQYQIGQARQIIYFTNGKQYIAFWYDPETEMTQR